MLSQIKPQVPVLVGKPPARVSPADGLYLKQEIFTRYLPAWHSESYAAHNVGFQRYLKTLVSRNPQRQTNLCTTHYKTAARAMVDQGIRTRSQRFEEFQRLVRELKEPEANPAQILTRMYNSFTTGFSKAEAENRSLRDAVSALTAELSSLKSQLNEVGAPEEP